MKSSSKSWMLVLFAGSLVFLGCSDDDPPVGSDVRVEVNDQGGDDVEETGQDPDMTCALSRRHVAGAVSTGRD